MDWLLLARKEATESNEEGADDNIRIEAGSSGLHVSSLTIHRLLDRVPSFRCHHGLRCFQTAKEALRSEGMLRNESHCLLDLVLLEGASYLSDVLLLRFDCITLFSCQIPCSSAKVAFGFTQHRRQITTRTRIVIQPAFPFPFPFFLRCTG